MTTMPPTITRPARFEPDDLLSMSDAVSYELADGKLVERKMSMESSRIGVRIGFLLMRAIAGRGIGSVYGADAGYQCFPSEAAKVRKPDVSFIRAGRLPADQARKGHVRVAPDLAVEVVSPNDLADEVADKVLEYIGAGVKLVWVVYPTTRQVVVHRQPDADEGPIAELSGGQTITGERIIDGFSCPVSQFFVED